MSRLIPFHWWVAGLAGALLLLPLMLNPGYYSHDEFEWAAIAASPASPTFSVLWGDYTAFQFRPLAFSLWMLLSQWLFATPRLFHTVFALIGLANALLFRALLLRLGFRAHVATLGMLLFLANPYTMYVNAWVGTPDDQLCLTAGVLIALLVTLQPTQRTRIVSICGLVAALTTAGLLAKEAAVVFPAVLGLSWLLTRRRMLLWSCVAATVPVVVYLALRLGVILDTPPQVATTYGWSLSLIPERWAQYVAFPLAIPIKEIWQLTLAPRWAAVVLGAGTFAMGLALICTAPRLGVWWLLAGGAALSPVLILVSASNQYGYAFAMMTAGVLAYAMPRAQGLPRLTLFGTGVLLVLHSGVVAWHMIDSGHAASVFVPAALNAVAKADTLPVRVCAGKDVPHWRFSRLLHPDPKARDAMGNGVVLVSDREHADYEVQWDGSLKALVNDRSVAGMMRVR